MRLPSGDQIGETVDEGSLVKRVAVPCRLRSRIPRSDSNPEEVLRWNTTDFSSGEIAGSQDKARSNHRAEKFSAAIVPADLVGAAGHAVAPVEQHTVVRDGDRRIAKAGPR